MTMSDIVERLRSPCDSDTAYYQRKEAADEIERLQAENDVLHKTDKWRYENVVLMKSEIERLTAECEEQARLNGMGAERELALRAEIERLPSGAGGTGMSGSTTPKWDEPTEVERLRAEIERLTSLLQNSEMTVGELLANDERLRAALSWVREVYPGRNKESDGAIVHMTWDQWNAMREVIGLKPQPLPPRSFQSVRIIQSRALEGRK